MLVEQVKMHLAGKDLSIPTVLILISTVQSELRHAYLKQQDHAKNVVNVFEVDSFGLFKLSNYENKSSL